MPRTGLGSVPALRRKLPRPGQGLPHAGPLWGSPHPPGAASQLTTPTHPCPGSCLVYSCLQVCNCYLHTSPLLFITCHSSLSSNVTLEKHSLTSFRAVRAHTHVTRTSTHTHTALHHVPTPSQQKPQPVSVYLFTLCETKGSLGLERHCSVSSKRL